MDNFYILAILVSFLWGAAAVFQKMLLVDINKETIMFISSIIYTIISSIFYLYNYDEIKNDIVNVTQKHLIIMLLISIFGTFLANLLFYKILKNQTSIIVTALTYTSPFFTLLLSYIFLKEEINQNTIIGLFLTVAGILLLVYENETKNIK